MKEHDNCTAGAVSREKSISHLIGVLENTHSRLHEAIRRYSVMNDGITGNMPEEGIKDSPKSVPNGQINQAIERAEALHDLCASLDIENNRLNTIVIDG